MVNFKENEELKTLNHSCAHVMAQAIKHLYPQAKFWVGPVVAEGFYYDVDLGDAVIRDEDIEKIEKEMKKVCKSGKRIVRKEISKEEAKEMFKDDEYKLDLIDGLEDGNITCYEQGDFTDLCRGPHVENVKLCRNFKLIRHSGAYWKGDSKNKVLQRITYRELRELSYMGATVLHEDAIFPVRKEGIPINIRNTNAPKDNGTWIVESTCQKPKYVITGIAGKKGFCSINIEKDLMNSEIGFGRKVLQAFEENEISFEHVPSGIDTMTVFVHQSEFMEKEQRVLAAIHKMAHPDSIDLESDLALIAVVGRGMRQTRGTAGRIFSALAHANVNVKMIDQGSSELNIIIGVKNEDFDAAIRAIYNIFVEVQL